MTDLEASAGSGLTLRSVERLRVRVCEVGPLGALERKQRQSPPVEPKVTGEVEARIVQIACSEAPEGRDCWTLKMIAEQLMELEIVESITSIRRTHVGHDGRRTALDYAAVTSR